MPVLENIRLALTSLRANKLRALLTMLGIIIGIGAVITIITIGDSLTGSFNDEMSKFGARNITLEVRQKGDPFFDQPAEDNGDFAMSGEMTDSFEYRSPEAADMLTNAMLTEYRKKFSSQLESLAVNEKFGSITVTNGRFKALAALVGATADQSKIDQLKLLAGRFLTEKDGAQLRAVAAVSDLFVQQYYGGKKTPEEALGQSFKLEAEGRLLQLYIVGVYKYQPPDGTRSTGKGVETNLYLPLATGKKMLQKSGGYASATLQIGKDTDTALFLKRTNAFFDSFYARNPHFTASASSMAEMMKSMNKMTENIKLGISAIAAISLLVGGIGVMNIMMVSVTERTREIGVRMALGAKARTILFQFIVEAVIVCLIGGMIGVLAGVVLGSAGASVMGYPARPSLWAALVAVVFSMSIGVFFGYYPAKKAALLDPIEALRYE